MSYLPGFDYSHYNSIDWPSVTGQAFAIGKVTEGTSFVDPLFSERRDAQRATSVLWGGYHFADATDAQAEADHFVATVGDLQPGEFLVLDYENQAYGDPAGWCAAFVTAVHDKTGIWPIVYAPRALMARIYSAVPNCGLWVADPDDSPNSNVCWPAGQVVPYRYVMHQYGQGELSGTSKIDLDAFFGTLDQLKAYGKPAPAPISQPQPSVDTTVDTSVSVPVTVTPTVVVQPDTPQPTVQPTNIDGVLPPKPVVPTPVIPPPVAKKRNWLLRFIVWLFS